ncbi:MAG: NTP transferase domain-containing protein [Thermoanaerobaculales bacterium]|nr:NTP transferase domain-containing protein [Thermoanaerobaculales bacterium]
MLAGLILAGGEGKRFGGPKAFARLDDGRTFLEVCAATLIRAGASPLVATLPPGTEDPQIDGLESIALPEPGMDMFASLVTGLRHLVEHPDWRTVAILPVDHPFVVSSAVTALANSSARAVIPSYKGKHGHPICLEREVAQEIDRGELPGPTLREVLRSVGAVSVEVDDPGVIANCNTPDALSAALRAANSEL